MTKARYCANVMNTEIGRVIQVIDLHNEQNAAMSVTNDAEAVVKKVVELHGDHRVIYRDTDGRWDELLHQNGRFTGFAPLACDALTRAIEVEVL